MSRLNPSRNEVEYENRTAKRSEEQRLRERHGQGKHPMSAPKEARARLSAILAEIDTLIGEFDELRLAHAYPFDDESAARVVDALDAASGEAREAIGDVFEDGEWQVGKASAVEPMP
jgi:hypothetical protein